VKVLCVTDDTVFVGLNPKITYDDDIEELKSQEIEPGSSYVPIDTLDSISEERITKTGSRITYSAKVKRVTLQRYLVSRVAFQPEQVTLGEILVMYDNLLWCQDKSLMNPDFQKKFGSSLEELTKILKRVTFHKENLPVSVRNLSGIFKSRLSDFLIPARNIPGVKIHVKGSYHILPTSSSGTPVKELPSKRFIGVGYKDKGNCRVPSWDGSPSWQEVAMHFGRKA